MVWINEIESAKSIADLKKSDTITGSKLQAHSEAHGSTMASLKKITIGDFKRRVFIQEEATKKNKALSREGKSHG